MVFTKLFLQYIFKRNVLLVLTLNNKIKPIKRALAARFSTAQIKRTTNAIN